MYFVLILTIVDLNVVVFIRFNGDLGSLYISQVNVVIGGSGVGGDKGI